MTSGITGRSTPLLCWRGRLIGLGRHDAELAVDKRVAVVVGAAYRDKPIHAPQRSNAGSVIGVPIPGCKLGSHADPHPLETGGALTKSKDQRGIAP